MPVNIDSDIAAIVCKVATLLVMLAWDTPHRQEACELAEQLIDALSM